MKFQDDPHLDVCQSIETGLKLQYDRHPSLTDVRCIFALENGKVAARQHFGFGKNEIVSRSSDIDGIIDWCVQVAGERVGKVNKLTRKEFNARVDKIIRSVRRHSQYGSRSYYEFIRNYLP